MRAVFSDEIKQFVINNAVGKMAYELTDMINKEFGTSYTAEQIKHLKNRLHLRSGVKHSKMKSRMFPYKVEEYIKENYIGISNSKLTEMVNTYFDTEYTIKQISQYKKRKKFNSGLTGRFEKGHVPANKGMKGVCAPGCKKTWFKKGQIPSGYRPVGSERVDNKSGYTLIKVADPNKWRLKHQVVWEEHHGPIPKGHKVIFLDGDRSNICIDNLKLVSDQELLIMNQEHLHTEDAALTSTGIVIAQLIETTRMKKKKSK